MTAETRDSVQGAPAPRFGRLAGAALLLSASFILSRLLGLARTAAMAHIFGNSEPINAYLAAFRIPDTVFTLVSGAALASAFIPTFAGLLDRGEEEAAWDVAGTVLTTVFVALGAFALVAFALAGPIMDTLVHGFSPANQDLTVHLTRIMLLQPIFLGVAALITSILQTRNRFRLTAFAPLVYNLSVIVGTLAFGRAHGVDALAWSVVLGALLYLLVQLPGLRRDAPLKISLNYQSAAAREVVRLFAPRVVGLAAFQVMLLITIRLASGLEPGSVGAISYSWILIQFPVGALGTAAATAIFPTLARLTAADDMRAVKRTLNRSLRLITFLSIPAAVGLIVLRRPIINLLANHGDRWTSANTEQTAFALLFFSLAIGPLSLIEVLARVFYAMKDTIKPVQIAIVAVVIDAVLSIVLVYVLPRASGQGGLALATAIASAVQVTWLALALQASLSGFGLKVLLRTFRDTALASIAMGMVLYIALDPLAAIFSQRGLGVFVTVVLELGLGLASFVLACWVLNTPELVEVRSFLGR